jgi:hypothetical protein
MREADDLTTFMCRMSWKSGSLTLLEPSGLHRACYGIAFNLYMIVCFVYDCKFCMLLFNFLNYVLLLLCLYILFVMYVPFCVFYFTVLFYPRFVCKCVQYRCYRLSTQLQLTNIYHIIPYYIVSYYIISYHIISYITSYHTILYHILYHITYQRGHHMDDFLSNLLLRIFF